MIFHKIRSYVSLTLVFTFLSFFCISAGVAFASQDGNGSPDGGDNTELNIAGGLKKVQATVTGPVAIAVSIIGIVIAGGVLIFGGDLNGFFRSLVFLALVIAVIVGANNVLQAFGGNGAQIGHSTYHIKKLSR